MVQIHKKKKGFLICFTGVDGSGKTSHAKSLLAFLSEKGYGCVYVWAASILIFSYPFFGFCRLLGYWRKIKEDLYTDPLEFAPERLRKGILGFAWRFFLFLDFHVKTLVKIRIPLFFGKIVICDRYIYGILLELVLSNLYSNTFGAFLVRTLPSPAVVFLTDVPENIAFRRRDISKNLLREKRKTYLKMTKTFNFIVINTQADFQTNQDQIRRETLSKLENSV
jgi:dTMP kinase